MASRDREAGTDWRRQDADRDRQTHRSRSPRIQPAPPTRLPRAWRRRQSRLVWPSVQTEPPASLFAIDYEQMIEHGARSATQIHALDERLQRAAAQAVGDERRALSRLTR